MVTGSVIVLLIITISGCVCAGLEAETSRPQDYTGFTEKYGIIREDETWCGNILVTGDILVKESVTLTILPGTEILVKANNDKNNLFGHYECGGIADFDMLKGTNNRWDNICGVHRTEPFRDEGNHISVIIRGTLKAVGEPNNRIVIKSDAQKPGIYD